MDDDLLARSPGAAMVLDTELSILVVSERTIELLGYPRDELLGSSAGALVAFGPAWVERELSVFMQQGRWHGDVAMRRKAGDIVNVVADAWLVPRPSGARILVTLERG